MAAKSRPRRQGFLPGEYQRKSLVSLSRQTLSGDADRHGHASFQKTEFYVVVTRRLDGIWTSWIEHEGQRWELPGQVVARLLSHREAIIKEQRRVTARERLRRRAEDDQQEAAQESQPAWEPEG